MVVLALRARTPAEAQTRSTRPYGARDEGLRQTEFDAQGRLFLGRRVPRSEGLPDPLWMDFTLGAEMLLVGRVLD